MTQNSQSPRPLSFLDVPLGYVLHTITTRCTNCGHESVHNEMFTCVRAGASGKAWHHSIDDRTIFARDIARNSVTNRIPLCDYCIDATIAAGRLTPLPVIPKAPTNPGNFVPEPKAPRTPGPRALSNDDLFVD
jgi:hypothetical protein